MGSRVMKRMKLAKLELLPIQVFAYIGAIIISKVNPHAIRLAFMSPPIHLHLATWQRYRKGACISSLPCSCLVVASQAGWGWTLYERVFGEAGFEYYCIYRNIKLYTHMLWNIQT